VELIVFSCQVFNAHLSLLEVIGPFSEAIILDFILTSVSEPQMN